MPFQESSDSDSDSDSSEYDDDVKDPNYIEEEVESDDTSDDDENNLGKQELPPSSIKGTNDREQNQIMSQQKCCMHS